MLEFWFNPQVSLIQKLAFFVAVAIATGVLYWMDPLSLEAILMFLGTGVVFLICRYCKIHFAAQNPTGLLYRLFTWIPIALLLALIFISIIGFMALAICLFSPLSLLNQNNPENTYK